MSDEERKERRQKWLKEYWQREDRKEKNRQNSRAQCRQRKLLSTAARFEQHTLEELLIISAIRCNELGIDFVANENVFLTAMTLLHGPENVQRE